MKLELNVESAIWKLKLEAICWMLALENQIWKAKYGNEKLVARAVETNS